MGHLNIGIDIKEEVIKTSRRIFALGENIYLNVKALTVVRHKYSNFV
jgi:hypothetical protein